jgi:hypothetical protein
VLNQPTPSEADDVSLASNRMELQSRCIPPILAEVKWKANGFDADVDWFALANQPPEDSQ